MTRNLRAGGAIVTVRDADRVPEAEQILSSNGGKVRYQSSDIAITRNIRRAVVKDKSLSTAAHNVTIITKDGKVTLKGRVKSDSEKQTVESAAASIAGAGDVDNQLTTSGAQ